MTSINRLLTPDLLFNIFKCLDCVETTRVRRVCKQWFEIIDEHKSFWRTLYLPKDSLKKWEPSILELFDQKSRSTLQHVEVGTGVGEDSLKEFSNVLQKSKETLRHLLFTSYDAYLDYGDPGYKLDLLNVLIKLEYLRVLSSRRICKVRLRRRSIKSASQEDESNAASASSLKVLWYGTGRSILEINSARLKNLVSLDSGAMLSASEWRGFLEGPSRNLKHLKIAFKDRDHEDHSKIPSLEFPKLEVLELKDGGEFPQWLLIPDSAKLITRLDVSNLPSVSEIWSRDVGHTYDLINRLPSLRTLCLSHVSYLNLFVEVLEGRKRNVEAGLKADGVKMEMIETLALPFNLSDPELSVQLKRFLRNCRELVDVVEGNVQARFIEVEY